MATFIWDPAVRWPPPAHILLNYDVVPPAVSRGETKGVLKSFEPTYGGVRFVDVTKPPGQSPFSSSATAEDNPERANGSCGSHD